MGDAEIKEKQSNQSRRGGARPGSGRPKGRKSAKTLEIEAKAKLYAGDALKALIDVAQNSENDGARVSAATAILDRGYGKPRQALEHSTPDGPLEVAVTHEIIDAATASAG